MSRLTRFVKNRSPRVKSRSTSADASSANARPVKTRSARFASGDTMVEVLFSITAYAVVALFTINTMNLGLQQGEASLELSMARTEISAQADAIRFIHNAYLSEREYNLTSSNSYKDLWTAITNRAVESSAAIPSLSVSSCSEPYTGSNNIFSKNAFIVNTRYFSLGSPSRTIIPANTSKFTQASLYPRVVYTTSAGTWDGTSASSDSDYLDEGTYNQVGKAEGIWVIARKSANTSSMLTGAPEYYDFHIYTCWYSPGSNHPSTVGTIIRLYNPALKEIAR